MHIAISTLIKKSFDIGSQGKRGVIFSDKQLNITSVLRKNRHLPDREWGFEGPGSLPSQGEVLWVMGVLTLQRDTQVIKWRRIGLSPRFYVKVSIQSELKKKKLFPKLSLLPKKLGQFTKGNMIHTTIYWSHYFYVVRVTSHFFLIRFPEVSMSQCSIHDTWIKMSKSSYIFWLRQKH